MRSSILTICTFKIVVFLIVFLRTSKFATSKSMFRARRPPHFNTSQKMPHLPRHLLGHPPGSATSSSIHHLLQPCNHEKCSWARPKCFACHERCNTSSDNIAKVLRLPHKMIFDTLPNTSTFHEVPRLPRETKLRDA